MGFLGGSNPQQTQANDEVDAQLRNNEAEVEAKKEQLTQTRLGIIKSQAGQNWIPDASLTQARLAPTGQSRLDDDARALGIKGSGLLNNTARRAR